MHSSQREFQEASTGITDKVVHHGYHRFYPWFLKEFRGKPVRLLEIGIDRLGSVQLWRRYFPQGLELHGIDRDEKAFEDKSVKLHKVDQGSAAELGEFVARVGTEFDIILDDGSHVPEHQLLSLKLLWKLVAPGGIYIVEDIETSYWGKSVLYGYEFDASKTSKNTIAQLRGAIDAVNAEFLLKRQRHKIAAHPLAAVLAEVEMVSFGQNCIILLKKDVGSFGGIYGRPYRYRRYVNLRSLLNRTLGHYQDEGIFGFVKALPVRFLRLLRRLVGV
jgi:hypothetical protein